MGIYTLRYTPPGYKAPESLSSWYIPGYKAPESLSSWFNPGYKAPESLSFLVYSWFRLLGASLSWFIHPFHCWVLKRPPRPTTRFTVGC